MKKVFTLLAFALAHFVSYGQCSTVSVQVSSSDTTIVQLYNAGLFNIPSGFDNIVDWEVTLFDGELIHEATTSGSATGDQSFSLFNHSVPITDSMKVTILITNETEGITCTMSDTLYWKETEVLPGAFIGNWDVLSSNGGVEAEITSTEATLQAQGIEVFPSPAVDHFNIKSDLNNLSFTVIDVNGQVVARYKDIQQQTMVDITQYASGIYFVRFWDEEGRSLGVKKIVKL